METVTAFRMSKGSELYRICEEQAVAFAKQSTHEYTQVDNFLPHDWVVRAMMAAYIQAVRDTENEIDRLPF